MVCKLHSLAANEQERERRKQRPEQSWHMVSHRKEGEGQRLSQREKRREKWKEGEREKEREEEGDNWKKGEKEARDGERN